MQARERCRLMCSMWFLQAQEPRSGHVAGCQERRGCRRKDGRQPGEGIADSGGAAVEGVHVDELGARPGVLLEPRGAAL